MLNHLPKKIFPIQVIGQFIPQEVLGKNKMRSRRPTDITGIIVHRIEVSQEDSSFSDTPADTVRFFAQHPIGKQATGGAMPYPIVIDGQGNVTQTLPLSLISPHAAKHNPHTIGLAAIGDFRTAPPTAKQYQAIVSVCRLLRIQFRLPYDAIYGHDTLPGASHDADKICPGTHLDIAQLRELVDKQRQDTDTTDTNMDTAYFLF